MPAIERAFSDLPPGRLYLDTDFILDYLIPTRAQHERCRLFLQRVLELGLTAVYISTLTWIEFGHVVRRPDFRDRLPDDWRVTYQFDQWEHPEIRRCYMNEMCGRLQAFLDAFEWFEVSVTSEVREGAIFYMTEYNLGPHDAVHLASAMMAGVIDLASFDRGFRRIDRLYLWNDQVYGTS